MYSHAVARLWFCSKLRYMEPLNEAMKSLRENIPDKCFLRCSGPERGFCDLLDLTNHKAAEQSTLKKDFFIFNRILNNNSNVGDGQIATVSKRNDGFKSQRTRPEW